MASGFSKRLKAAMDKRGVSSTELSRRSGITRSNISLYLHGKSIPRDGNIKRIAEALNIDEYWLSGGDVSMEKENRHIISDIQNIHAGDCIYDLKTRKNCFITEVDRKNNEISLISSSSERCLENLKEFIRPVKTTVRFDDMKFCEVLKAD